MYVLSCFSRVQCFETLWTVAHQAPLSMGFSRQEYWSGLPCPPPGDLPDPGIDSVSLVSPTLAGSFFTTEMPGKPDVYLGAWNILSREKKNSSSYDPTPGMRGRV